MDLLQVTRGISTMSIVRNTRLVLTCSPFSMNASTQTVNCPGQVAKQKTTIDYSKKSFNRAVVYLRT